MSETDTPSKNQPLITSPLDDFPGDEIDILRQADCPTGDSSLEENSFYGDYIADTPAAPLIPRRKRGGQPGNQNACKAGFYSRAYSRTDNRDTLAYANAIDFGDFDLLEEILLLKVMIRSAIQKTENLTVIESANLLRSVAFAINTLTRASRLQATDEREQSENDSRKNLMHALELARREMINESQSDE